MCSCGPLFFSNLETAPKFIVDVEVGSALPLKYPECFGQKKNK